MRRWPALFFAFLTSLVTFLAVFLLPLPLAALRLLRGPFALRSYFLALRPWRLLLTLDCPLRRRLPLILGCRASLLSRALGWGGRLRTGGRWRSLLSPLSRRGRSLRCLLLIVLPHYGVTRLVTVILVVKRRLLLRSGIPVS